MDIVALVLFGVAFFLSVGLMIIKLLMDNDVIDGDRGWSGFFHDIEDALKISSVVSGALFGIMILVVCLNCSTSNYMCHSCNKPFVERARNVHSVKTRDNSCEYYCKKCWEKVKAE